MMSHSIVRPERIHEMFAMLANLDDSPIFEIIQRYETDALQQDSILKAYKSLVSVAPPLLDAPIYPVSRIGIVGARSVTTAYWPYLILACILGISVKIKLHLSDVHHVTMLSEFIQASSLGKNDLINPKLFCDWEVSNQSGDALLKDGYWDDCDRLLVFGSDVSVAHYHQHFPEPGRVIGFGHLESVMLVTLASLQADCRWIEDVLAFGHIGCLAPRLVVPMDDVSPEQIAEVMMAKLQNRVSPDIGRAVTLRNEFHGLRVAGIDAWLSKDGMWLISANQSLPYSSIPGHLNVVSLNSVVTSGYTIGALSMPTLMEDTSAEISALQAVATWKCVWGMAQFPSMLWANGGIPIVATLSHRGTKYWSK